MSPLDATNQHHLTALSRAAAEGLTYLKILTSSEQWEEGGMMQKFAVQLERPVDETSFAREWQIQNRELNVGPNVDFGFDGTTGTAILHTFRTTQWPADNFRRALQLVLHRIDVGCDIVTIRAIAE